jgi:hypothetical protein
MPFAEDGVRDPTVVLCVVGRGNTTRPGGRLLQPPARRPVRTHIMGSEANAANTRSR